VRARVRRLPGSRRSFASASRCSAPSHQRCPENVLGEVNRGASVLMSGLDLERLVLSGVRGFFSYP
jgi:hypothetical protein